MVKITTLDYFHSEKLVEGNSLEVEDNPLIHYFLGVLKESE